MANSDKNLVIVPNVGSSSGDPTITFSGADPSLGPQSLQARIYPTSNGTLSFEGSAGQLFSITNSLTGTIYSVNDVSGLPSIEVFDTGVVRLARYSGRVIIGNIADNGNDTLQFATGGSISLPNINSTGNVTAIRYTSNVATGTAPFTVSSTTTVANLSADKVDGVDIGTLTAAGGIAYATSTSALAATGAGTSGQAVISGGAGAPTFQTVSSANGASTIVARDASGSFTSNAVNATEFRVSSSAIINNNRTIQNYGITHTALGSGSGTRTINLLNGNFFSATVAGATTFVFSNPLTSPSACGFVLELTNGGSSAIVWPATVRWPYGTAPALTASGVDVLVFITDDGGSNWRGVISMTDSK